MSLLDAYRRAGCLTDASVLDLAEIHGVTALAEARAALCEDSQANMVRLLGISRAAAKLFQRFFGGLSFAAAKACVLMRGPERFRSDDQSGLDYEIWDAINELDSTGLFLGPNDGDGTEGSARAFSSVLSKYGIAKKITSDSVRTRADVDRIMSQYHERDELASKKPVLKLPNGWKWVDMGGCSSEIEKKQMAHCGADDRGNLYSLRDSNGNPHVTLTMDDRRQIHQVRGKANSTPDQRYWPAIKQFMHHFDADLAMHRPAIKDPNADDMWQHPDGVSAELDRFLYDESRQIREAGRQNSVAMFVAGDCPPGRNTCALIRNLVRDRSRLIVVSRDSGLPVGGFETMLRASMPDCEKRIRVMESQGSLIEIIQSAAQNRHYSSKQVLEVFCDAKLAAGYAHDSTQAGLPFDPGLVSVRSMDVPLDDSGAIVRALGGDDHVAQQRVLDPHVFSSAEGMARAKSAVNPSRPAMESLVREFLSDISGDRDEAIDALWHLLSQRVDTSSLEYLGSGRNGSAYRHERGFVMKVTTDPAEVESAKILVDARPQHLGRVFDIECLSDGVWLLIQEDLSPLDDDSREEFDLAIQVIEGANALDDLNAGDLGTVVHRLAGARPETRRSMEMAVGTLRRFDVPKMCAELNALGLTADFHSGNIMLRGDSPVLVDLGTPGDDPGTIREFGSGAPGSGASGPPTMRGSNSSSWSNGRGALKAPSNHVPEDENADEDDFALDWGPGRVSGASF